MVHSGMFDSTKEERDGFIRDAIQAYPTLSVLDATLRLALCEAREAVSMLDDSKPRTSGVREFRDRKV